MKDWFLSCLYGSTDSTRILQILGAKKNKRGVGHLTVASCYSTRPAVSQKSAKESKRLQDCEEKLVKTSIVGNLHARFRRKDSHKKVMRSL